MTGAVAVRPRHAVDTTTRPLPAVPAAVHTDPSWDLSAAALSLAGALRAARDRGYPAPSDARVACRKVVAPLTYTGVLQWQQLLTKPRISRADHRYLHVTGHLDGVEWHLYTDGGTR